MRLNGVTIKLQVDDWRRARDSGFCWYVQQAGRKANGRRPAFVVGQRQIKGVRVRVYLNRFIMDAKPDEMVFHKNGDKLNFRRHNLVKIKTRRRKADVDLPTLPAHDARDQDGRAAHPDEGAVF